MTVRRQTGHIHYGPERTPALPRSYLAGLGMSNDTDSDHDIAIAVGECRNTGDDCNLVLSSVLTKQIDATWAAGDDAGGMNDGDSVGNNEWFHVFLIGAPGGAVDAGFDTNTDASLLLADAAVAAAGFTKYRRIGSVRTDGSANIVAFVQYGDEFVWSDATTWSIAATTSAALYTCPYSPLGVACKIDFKGTFDAKTQFDEISFYPANGKNTAPTQNNGYASLICQNGNYENAGHFSLMTNTSAQIGAILGSGVTVNTNFAAVVMSYTDRRGRDD